MASSRVVAVARLHEFIGEEVAIRGWVAAKEKGGSWASFLLTDYTGSVFVRVNTDDHHLDLNTEALVQAHGKLVVNNNNTEEVFEAEKVQVIAPSSSDLAHSPRVGGGFAARRSLRHLFLRNRETVEILKFRSFIKRSLREWLSARGFIEFDAPILTPTPLYPHSPPPTVKLKLAKEKYDTVYLTQCVSFYLEAAIFAFEKVYNIGPSFRNEDSRGPRHLLEFWHVKAEMAYADLADAMALAESIVRMTIKATLEYQWPDHYRPPSLNELEQILDATWPKVTYTEAYDLVKDRGCRVEWGAGLESCLEKWSPHLFSTPIWVVGNPRAIEPFPYRIDEKHTWATKTADMILPGGYGELLGVAEKICNMDELYERLAEKGLTDDGRYAWVKDLRRYGCVPHSGMGMGLERLLRWLLGRPHVRDTIPFPREARRKVYP